jgi:hypothetical protein
VTASTIEIFHTEATALEGGKTGQEICKTNSVKIESTIEVDEVLFAKTDFHGRDADL